MNIKDFFCKLLRWWEWAYNRLCYRPALPKEKVKPTLPKIPKLDPKKKWSTHKKLLSPSYHPLFGIDNAITDSDAEGYAVRFAQGGWGNFLRFSIATNLPDVSLPYKRSLFKKKFNLKRRNQKHFDKLFRRAGYLADRDIIPMFTLLHPDEDTWDTNWMNGKNNVNHTHKKFHSLTHWYEYDGVSEFHKEEVIPGMKETGEYLMDLYDYVLDKAKEYFGEFFLIEIGNQVDGKVYYHRTVRHFINEKFGGINMNRRVFTSMKDYSYYSKVGVYSTCVPIIHGVADYDTYLELKNQYVVGKHGARQHGTWPLAVEETTANVKAILKSDCLLYEGDVASPDYLQAYAEAFEKYLG